MDKGIQGKKITKKKKSKTQVIGLIDNLNNMIKKDNNNN